MIKNNSVQKAVAVKYPEGAEVPFIVAKGSGIIAQKIISEAEKNNIHIEENENLVEILSEVKIGSEVPVESWEILAQIFSFILSIEKKN